MVKIENKIVEDAILEEIGKLRGLSSVDAEAEIDKECKPGIIGVRSQILVDIMGKLEETLGVTIPNNCYIFRDGDGIRELTIREAAEKLIKIAKNAKQ
jgi:acyl carrier protein